MDNWKSSSQRFSTIGRDMGKHTEDKVPDVKAGSDSPEIPITSSQMGIWQFWTLEPSSRLELRRQWEELISGIEVGIREGQVDSYAIYFAIVSRLSCIVFVEVLYWWTKKSVPAFEARVTQHYDMYLMRVFLSETAAGYVGFTSLIDPDSQPRITARDAWRALDAIVSFLGQIITSASQLTLIIHVSRSSGAAFAFLCLMKPLLETCFSRSAWSGKFLVHLNNKHYQRMQALAALTADKYRQDYITGNLGPHILAAEMPMIYWAINAVMNPTKFSIAFIAILEQTSTNLRYSMETIFVNSKSFQRHVSQLKNLYALSEKRNKLKDGDLPYPCGDTKDGTGMSFELRNVTFCYPGSKARAALQNVSFTIRPGQLAVIVGANGSGKSTIIKLLTRLYDPSEGALLVDGIPAEQYSAFDLRRAMATFTQDHQLYPLSLYENIALGNPAATGDSALVAAAAEQGGAAVFIGKLPKGMGTLLDPQNQAYPMNIPSDPDHPLRKQMDALSKKTDISGGEKQRLVASRTFMHLNSGKVAFVAVDEPSSALDSEGEAQLFGRLIAERSGRTMVFVTHRFGHLTKHADIIICMKDGMVAESDTHDELLKQEGEYAKLYNIQASAFSSDIT
ncbi:hypothetical protein H0H81_007085 [Sphagnurus paluster]|uniref:ABC transporter domain-containing protein n=1 Tax=Sphagnurus paluster TaxID=117069 RepID=A0A9P7K4M4_9AGAR|nr:hypothetical protein H0H81_007085 [Sphagnurus paluster]